MTKRKWKRRALRAESRLRAFKASRQTLATNATRWYVTEPGGGAVVMAWVNQDGWETFFPNPLHGSYGRPLEIWRVRPVLVDTIAAGATVREIASTADACMALPTIPRTTRGEADDRRERSD